MTKFNGITHAPAIISAMRWCRRGGDERGAAARARASPLSAAGIGAGARGHSSGGGTTVDRFVARQAGPARLGSNPSVTSQSVTHTHTHADGQMTAPKNERKRRNSLAANVYYAVLQWAQEKGVWTLSFGNEFRLYNLIIIFKLCNWSCIQCMYVCNVFTTCTIKGNPGR